MFQTNHHHHHHRQEIKKGITIETEDGTPVGLSTSAALAALQQVIPSRIG